ncbi:MAG: hypothetical protein ACKOW0_00790 [Schleiferiaceae bacterium]
MSTAHHTSETITTIAAKAAPPVTASIATLAGYQVSEILIWATLIYTLLMIGHKVWQIVKELREL